MDQVYIDTLNRIENEGIAGLVFNGIYQFDVKFEENTLYFSKVIDYRTKATIVPSTNYISCTKEQLNLYLDKIVIKFVDSIVYPYVKQLTENLQEFV